MTVQTIFKHGFMLEFQSIELFTKLFVTRSTELLARHNQIHLMHRGMWVVTLQTLPIGNNLMDAYRTRKNYFTVAPLANFTRLPLNQFCIGRRVRGMTPSAHPLSQWVMNNRLRHLLVECYMAFEAEFAVGARFKLELGGGIFNIIFRKHGS